MTSAAPARAVLATLFAGALLLAQPPEFRWTAEKTAELGQFSVPECVLPVPGRDPRLFVTNVDADKDQYWTDDGKGFLSLLEGTTMKRLRWLRSLPDARLDGPKGMCILGDRLYFTDNTRLLRCNLADGRRLEVVAENFGKANDLASDGDGVWLSDGQEGKIWRVASDGAKREIPAPKGVNGLTFDRDGRMFAVSWDLHEVYEVFPVGDREPHAFGLAKHFTNLDGIEVLGDGTFVVSDFMGDKVCAITPDRRSVHTLAELKSPADIGIDREAMLLYVPQFYVGKVAVFKLRQTFAR